MVNNNPLNVGVLNTFESHMSVMSVLPIYIGCRPVIMLYSVPNSPK